MRCDGKRLRMPLYDQIIPYLEPRRCDSMNQIRLEFDTEPLSEYLASLPPDAPVVSYLSLIIAAYVRALRKFPQINRFIKGKHFYQRKEINVSFVVLKSRSNDGTYEETVLKIKINPDATLFEVCEQINKAVEDNQKITAANRTDKLLSFVMRAGPLISVVVAVARFLDHFAMLPKAIIEGSPFHTGLFVTNLMSIRTNYVYHHLYEFGTTSLFAAMGNCEKKLVMQDGQVVEKRFMPVGVVVDERVSGGYTFSCFVREFESYMRKPKRLETLDS